MRIWCGRPGLDRHRDESRAFALREDAHVRESGTTAGRGRVHRAEPRVRHRADRHVDRELRAVRPPARQREVHLLDAPGPPGRCHGAPRALGAREQHQPRGAATEAMHGQPRGSSDRTRCSSVCSRKPPFGTLGSPRGLATASSSASRCRTANDSGTSGSCHGGRRQASDWPARSRSPAPAIASLRETSPRSILARQVAASECVCRWTSHSITLSPRPRCAIARRRCSRGSHPRL